MPRYKVMVDDNFHYQEDDRWEQGVYESAERAIAACRGIVDKSLEEGYRPGISAKKLYDHYASFGDDPFVVVLDGADERAEFSAWSYAKERCRIICQKRTPRPQMESMDPLVQRFADEHRLFLEDNNPDVLRQQDDPTSYIYSVGSQAAERWEHLMSQYHHSPEVQKLQGPARVRALQSRQHEIEEVIRDEIGDCAPVAPARLSQRPCARRLDYAPWQRRP
jgi:hypothetical protein